MRSPKFHIGQQVIARDDTEVYVGFINDATFKDNEWAYLLGKEPNTFTAYSGTTFSESEIIYYLKNGQWTSVKKTSSRPKMTNSSFKHKSKR